MANPKVRIAGIEAEVVSAEVAETCTAQVCVPWDGPAYFADDVRGACVACGRAVRYRPYSPKRPPKVCIGCAPEWLAATRH
jgi:hypothetical protein